LKEASNGRVYENKEGDRSLGTKHRKLSTANIILYLIYPKTEFFTEEKVLKYHDVNTIELHIFPADLESGTPYPIP